MQKIGSISDTVMEILNFPASSFFSDQHAHTIMPILFSGRTLHFPKLSATSSSSSESHNSKQVKFAKKISQNSATSVRRAGKISASIPKQFSGKIIYMLRKRRRRNGFICPIYSTTGMPDFYS